MSKKELNRLEIMQRIEQKTLKQREGAEMIGVSERQIRRILRKYRQEGAEGLISRRRGKRSNNRLKRETTEQARDLIYSKYRDFGPTLAHEKLTEDHGLQISVESVRQLMIKEGIWKSKKARRATIHQMRERRACLGELVQIDGSPHDWFEGRGPRCDLLVYIDDATGRLMELYFTPSETTFSYWEATRRYILRHGKPRAFYSDKHGIFRINAKNALSGSGMTQFGRAMKELEIEIICANTPQAKGRVERANKTLQDRLVKEMRLRDISSIEQANAYMPEFIEQFNKKFAVVPRSSHNAHRSLLPTDNLNLVFTFQETRTLSKNLTLQYKKVVYQIQTNRPGYAMRNAPVTVCENAQGEITILYKGHPLTFSLFCTQQRQADVVTSKDIDSKLSKPSKPAHDHPWRSYGKRMNGKPVLETVQNEIV